jgi:hypothetical protein
LKYGKIKQTRIYTLISAFSWRDRRFPANSSLASIILKIAKGDSMRAMILKLSGSVFILIIICFFLPFLSISCNNQQVAQLSGVQLATGTEVAQPALLLRESRKVPPQFWAVIPFGLAVAGVGLSFWQKGKIGMILQTIGGSVAVASLLLLKTKIYHDALQYPKFIFYLEFLPCYWITVWLFTAVAVLNLTGLVLVKKRKERSPRARFF